MRFNLRGKMLIFTCGIVTLMTGLSLVVSDLFLKRWVQRELEQDLMRTQSVFESVMSERALWLRSQCWVVAEDPRFVAPLDIESPDFASQARTVLREAEKFQNIIGSDRFVVTDRRGRVLAHVELISGSGESLANVGTVAQALKGELAAGPSVVHARTYQMTSVPVTDGKSILGTFSVGFKRPLDEEHLGDVLEALLVERRVPDMLRSNVPSPSLNLIREIRKDFGADLVAVTNSQGRALALVVRRSGFDSRVRDSAGVREAMQGHEWTGLDSDESRLFQAVVVPIWSQGEVIGTLETGFEINDVLAQSLKQMTQSEVSFLIGDRIIASSLSASTYALVESARRAESSFPGSQGKVAPLVIGEKTHLMLPGRLGKGEGSNSSYLVQRSLDEAIRFLHQLERILLLIGGVLLALAVWASYIGTARILKPVRALLEGTRRLASGNLGHHINVETRDEIGELARSFNEMGQALHGSQQALAESESQYRNLFDEAQDVVFTTDLEMRLTSINRAGLTLLGFPLADLIGRSVHDFLAEKDVKRVQDYEREHPPGSPLPALEVQLVCSGKRTATLEVASRWIIEGGVPVGRHGIGRDIAERRERERAKNQFREQLHQTEKLRALGEMAAGVAHNFNNVLTGVIGYAQLFHQNEQLPDELREDARRIFEAGQRCAAIVRRIQTFGRPIDASTKELVRLDQVIQDTLEITRSKWKTGPEREGREVQVELELGQVPAVQSTGAVWEEIISNLIFNAVDAMPDGGTIRIVTQATKDQLTLLFSDSGMGMDDRTQRKIFEPFFTTKVDNLGTGLGLSTVWGLVQGSGGQIEVESHPGEGTTFTISLPIPKNQSDSNTKVSSVGQTSGLNILVVDDESSVSEVLKRMLGNHDVDSAENGIEAQEMLNRRIYDLVITDWSMPGLSGLDLAHEVKSSSPQTLTALMTGWSTHGTAASESPDIDFLLSKPIVDRDLRKILSVSVRHTKAFKGPADAFTATHALASGYPETPAP